MHVYNKYIFVLIINMHCICPVTQNVLLFELKTSQQELIYDSFPGQCNDYYYSLLEHYNQKIEQLIAHDPDIRKFFTQFSPSVSLLIELIEEFNSFSTSQKQKIAINPRSYNTFSKIPTVYFKHGNSIFRIVCAYRMRKLIKEKKYTKIKVPQKYIFFIENNIVCVTEKITSTCSYPVIIDSDYMKELIDFINNTGFADFSSGNIIIDENHTMYFIDTEIRSFSLHTPSQSFNLQCLQNYLSRNKHLYSVTPQAQKLLSSCITEYKISKAQRNGIISQIREKDAIIDYKKVQIWFRTWNASQLNSDHILYDRKEYDAYIN